MTPYKFLLRRTLPYMFNHRLVQLRRDREKVFDTLPRGNELQQSKEPTLFSPCHDVVPSYQCG